MWVLLKILFSLQQWKNFENPLRIEKVITVIAMSLVNYCRSPTSISRHSDLCHAPHIQHLRRPMLRCCRSTAMELLPINLRQCHSLEQFKRLLKTFLFSAWGHGALWHLPESAPYINPLTYLLTCLGHSVENKMHHLRGNAKPAGCAIPWAIRKNFPW